MNAPDRARPTTWGVATLALLVLALVLSVSAGRVVDSAIISVLVVLSLVGLVVRRG
jgi:hypothetical protein